MLGQSGKNVARSTGNSDGETDCRRGADCVMGFYIAVKHEWDRQHCAAARHQAKNDAYYDSHKERARPARQLARGFGFDIEQNLGGGNRNEYHKNKIRM